MSNVTTIDFLARFTGSDHFQRVFKEGMGLVEETANYLDGPGRADVRELDRNGAVAYATESMRLTTRLMQLASWLLLQRAVGSGEMSSADASSEKHRISLADIGQGNTLSGAEQLPEALNNLINRSLALHLKVQKLDEMMNTKAEPEGAAPSAVGEQLARLVSAFKSARG